jgi:hypothetical protein
MCQYGHPLFGPAGWGSLDSPQNPSLTRMLFDCYEIDYRPPNPDKPELNIDGTCYRFQYNVIIALKAWSYLCGSGFPAAIKWIYSDFLSWLESHSHEQLVLSY